MRSDAVEAYVERTGVVNGNDAWKLTLVTESGDVVHALALPTRERSFMPLNEASDALTRLGYSTDAWSDLSQDRWIAELVPTGPLDTIVVHFMLGATELSGTVLSHGVPEFVELQVGEYDRFWKIIEETKGAGSADAHYRKYEGLEFPDSPVCTDARLPEGRRE